VGGDKPRKETRIPRIFLGYGDRGSSSLTNIRRSCPPRSRCSCIIYFPRTYGLWTDQAPLSLRSLVTPVTNSVLSLSFPLFYFHPSILHPRAPAHPDSRSGFFFQLYGSRGCFLSIFANRQDLKSRKQPLSRSFFLPSRLSIVVFYFSLFFFSSFMLPLKENLPCDPAKSARAFYVPGDPHGIVSRSSARTGWNGHIGTSSERSRERWSFARMTNQSHAPAADPMNSPATNAIEEENSWHAPLGSSGSDDYRTNKYRMHGVLNCARSSSSVAGNKRGIRNRAQFSIELWISKPLPEAILVVILLSLGMVTRRLQAGDCLAVGR